MHAVLLNSGGLDSALLAAKLHKDGVVLHSLYVDTGQVNREATLEAAAITANLYCASHKVVTVDFGHPSNYYIDANGVHVYDGSDTSILSTIGPDNLHVTPNLTPVMVSLGVSYARYTGASVVYSGTKGHVPAQYADQYNWLLQNNGRVGSGIHVEMPLLTLGIDYKELAAHFGLSLSEFEYTHSCRLNEPCGACYKCGVREVLFGKL